MKVITTTEMRHSIKTLIDQVKYRGDTFAIGRHDSIDALVIQFPHHYNKNMSDIANMNTYSKSFDFLHQEPDIYSIADCKDVYVAR